MRKIALLNGPPYSGKDTAARFLEREYGYVAPYYAAVFKFSTPLKNACASFFNIRDTERRAFEQDKERPQPVLCDMSWRQAQISMSEDWAKHKFGPDVFGRLMINQIEASAARLCIISDSGFEVEAWPLIHEYGIKNCLNVHLSRDGCTFENDSRSYWEIDGMTTVDVNNRLSLDMFDHQICRVVQQWLQPRQS
jgi:hypothetical protein